jgi:hypothetical protein
MTDPLSPAFQPPDLGGTDHQLDDELDRDEPVRHNRRNRDAVRAYVSRRKRRDERDHDELLSALPSELRTLIDRGELTEDLAVRVERMRRRQLGEPG